MKKIIITAITALLCLPCFAHTAKNVEKNSDTLIAYFSASGVTKKAAERMAKVINADVYEITPEAIYTSEDLDWRNRQSRSSNEMQDKAARPAIKGKVKNMKKYKTVYIGFPIWWNTCPRIINTFIESYSFKGKTLIPFATSGSSSIDGSCKDLKATYPDYNWKEGKLLNSVTDEQLKEWLK